MARLRSPVSRRCLLVSRRYVDLCRQAAALSATEQPPSFPPLGAPVPGFAVPGSAVPSAQVPGSPVLLPVPARCPAQR